MTKKSVFNNTIRKTNPWRICFFKQTFKNFTNQIGSNFKKLYCTMFSSSSSLMTLFFWLIFSRKIPWSSPVRAYFSSRSRWIWRLYSRMSSSYLSFFYIQFSSGIIKFKWGTFNLFKEAWKISLTIETHILFVLGDVFFEFVNLDLELQNSK